MFLKSLNALDPINLSALMTSLDLSLMVTSLYCFESYCDILADSRGTLLGNGTINSVARMEHVTP